MGNWRYTLRGFEQIFEKYGDDDLSSRTDAIAGKLARLNEKMRDDGTWDEDFDDLIENFSSFGGCDSDDFSYFEVLMENLYDWADEHRVWIEPRGEQSSDRSNRGRERDHRHRP